MSVRVSVCMCALPQAHAQPRAVLGSLAGASSSSSTCRLCALCRVPPSPGSVTLGHMASPGAGWAVAATNRRLERSAAPPALRGAGPASGCCCHCRRRLVVIFTSTKRGRTCGSRNWAGGQWPSRAAPAGARAALAKRPLHRGVVGGPAPKCWLGRRLQRARGTLVHGALRGGGSPWAWPGVSLATEDGAGRSEQPLPSAGVAPAAAA